MPLHEEVSARVTEYLGAMYPGIVVSDDPNVPFVPPPGEKYVEVRFVDGAEQFRTIGGIQQPFIQPVLCYIDCYTPGGIGDGLAREMNGHVRDALRRFVTSDGRWKRFEAGAEGKQDNGNYRKQVIALFWRTGRV